MTNRCAGIMFRFRNNMAALMSSISPSLIQHVKCIADDALYVPKRKVVIHTWTQIHKGMCDTYFT